MKGAGPQARPLSFLRSFRYRLSAEPSGRAGGAAVAREIVVLARPVVPDVVRRVVVELVPRHDVPDRVGAAFVLRAQDDDPASEVALRRMVAVDEVVDQLHVAGSRERHAESRDRRTLAGRTLAVVVVRP